MIAVGLAVTGPASALAQVGNSGLEVGSAVSEAALRFDLPPTWIVGVMRRESGFDARAVSAAGAIGLMQVMPATYADLRRRYGLGADPLQPRDNVLAGAAYLRELYDRFGAGGFLAAYNAGPERYLRSLIGAAKLPSETRFYVRQLRHDLGLPVALPSAPPSVFVPADVSVAAGFLPPTAGLFAPIGFRPGGSGYGP